MTRKLASEEDCNHVRRMSSNIEAISKPILGFSEKTQVESLGEIMRLYQTRNAEDIQSFLFTRAELISPLIEGHKRLSEFFPETMPEIELHHDDEGSSRLIVGVRTTLPLNEAFERMERFNDSWWVNAVLSVQGLLSFDLRLQ
jgi:hypothetical protein